MAQQFGFNPQFLNCFPTPLLLNLSTMVKTEGTLNVQESSQSLPTSTASSSRCSSVETNNQKIRRGRPQQNIVDGEDTQSQKKKHRRLYARKYRAEMRQKVDNVKSLSEEKEQLEVQVRKLQLELAKLQQECAQKDAYIGLIHLSTNFGRV